MCLIIEDESISLGICFTMADTLQPAARPHSLHSCLPSSTLNLKEHQAHSFSKFKKSNRGMVSHAQTFAKITFFSSHIIVSIIIPLLKDSNWATLCPLPPI